MKYIGEVDIISPVAFKEGLSNSKHSLEELLLQYYPPGYDDGSYYRHSSGLGYSF